MSIEDLKDLKFLLQHPEYEHRPVTMREFLENPDYVPVQDRPRPYNKKLLIDFFDGFSSFEEFENLGRFEELLYIAGIGSGKCLAKGTPVMRSSGRIDVVENIKKGDLLMGWDSKPRKVTSLSRGKEEMYKIIPTKGQPFIVNASHVLSLKRINKGIIAKNGKIDSKAGEIINIPVRDYLSLSNKMKGILKLWRTGIDFNEKKVNIDPYFLGLWLGDGNSHNLGISTQDNEIREATYKQAHDLGLSININKNKNKSCPTYIITTGKSIGGHDRNKLLNKFKKLGLLKNKHIPHKYKTNSREIRLQLLAGLIDTDGYQGNNCLEFSNKNKRLCKDVLYLCRSLGFAAYLKRRETKCRGKTFELYRISISGDLSKIPTRLARKKCSPRKQKKNHLVTGFKVESIGVGDYYGFEVDKDHLYLLGDFTVTHNSYISSMAICYIVYRLLCLKDPQEYFHFAKDTRIAFINISKSFSQAKDVVFGELKNRIDNNQWFQTHYPPDPRIKSKLRMPKNIYVLPVGSNEEAPLGYNIFGAVIDEASFHTATKEKDYAEESYNQIKKRIRSRYMKKGKLFIITSPRYVYDFAETKFEAEEGNPKVMRRRAALWEVMPEERYEGPRFDVSKYLTRLKDKNIMVPVEFEEEFKQNPERAMRDYGAQASLAIEGLFNDPAIVSENANRERFHPWNSKLEVFEEWFWNYKSSKEYDDDRRVIHIDLGLNKEGRGDCAGLAMGKFNGWVERKSVEGKMEKRPSIFIDLMMRIKAKSAKDEIMFEDVRQIVYRLQDIGYNIHLVSFDGWQCNLGSNQVKLLNGTSKRIDQITEKTWIYSYDLKKKEIVPTLCGAARKTGTKVPVYEVEIDNGEKVHFTSEHLILMKNGTYKEVKELKLGDSLMPIYTKYYKRRTKTRGIQKYEKILQPKSNKWQLTHDMVAKNIYGEKPKNNVVHHKNFNSEDNRPSNLQYCHVKDHLKLHKKLNELRWTQERRHQQARLMRERNKKFNLPSLLKPPTKKTAKKISLTIKNKWNNDQEYRTKMKKRPTYYGDQLSRFNKKISNQRLFTVCTKSESMKEVQQKLGLKNHLFIIRRLQSLGYKGFRDYKSQTNHKVVSVKFHGYEDVYDIEVPKTHNFGLAAGIFVHNSVDSVQTLRSAGINADFLSIDRNPEAYYTMKAAILDKRLDYYNYKPFIEEAQSLEELKGKKIDHPRSGSKDVSDAVAGVCFHTAKGSPGTGFMSAG